MELSSMKPIIKAENVSRFYHMGRRDEVRALQDISLEVQENQTVVLYGPSGSGKTTLLSLMGTIDRPTGGKIYLKGRDVTRFSDLELSRIRRETIGFVFQGFNLFAGFSAWENVSYPLIPMGINARERFQRAETLLEKLGLGDRFHHSPEELSGGEQQRVAIARALVNNPQILIADEPTSNIDAHSIERLLEILGGLKKEGKTLIISSHDPLFKGQGDVLFNLDRGKLQGISYQRNKGKENDDPQRL
ncbi:MAG: ABC transporter ATP-binding protein [Desulfobacteraceae bacterium]|jgi:putative ABC transport system ATP-binding protein